MRRSRISDRIIGHFTQFAGILEITRVDLS